ncbi:MAG: hypothetical protein NT076_04325 [Candidatus Pacearchaeota archaeon]|nr:hypothetical protein [Candidatus Pacearchaeota archaeon]
MNRKAEFIESSEIFIIIAVIIVLGIGFTFFKIPEVSITGWSVLTCHTAEIYIDLPDSPILINKGINLSYSYEMNENVIAKIILINHNDSEVAIDNETFYVYIDDKKVAELNSSLDGEYNLTLDTSIEDKNIRVIKIFGSGLKKNYFGKSDCIDEIKKSYKILSPDEILSLQQGTEGLKLAKKGYRQAILGNVIGTTGLLTIGGSLIFIGFIILLKWVIALIRREKMKNIWEKICSYIASLPFI